MHTTPVQLLKNQWNHFIATHGSEEKFLQFSSSGGLLHVYNALLTSQKSVQQRIISAAFAPAAIIPKRLCFESYNYTHRDLKIGNFAKPSASDFCLRSRLYPKAIWPM